jgi:Ca-activated chloride channel family protein
MSWGHPEFLWALMLPLAALLIFWRAGERRADDGLLRVSIAGARVVPAEEEARRRTWALPVALALAVVALAQPRWGSLEHAGQEPAREVVIALDLSRSMLVDDVAPTRLKRAHAVVRSLLDGLHGERVALVVFAGSAYVQVPLSSDYQILREFLPALEPGYLPQGGSDYAGMLRAVSEGYSDDAASDRTLFVLSDGESTTEGWREELAQLQRRGVTVVALGIGTPQGGDVPPVNEGEKSPTRSHLESATLQAIASGTGMYRDASTALDVPGLLAESVELGRKTRGTKRQTEDRTEQFAWLLVPALALGMFGLWREVTVRPRARTIVRTAVRAGLPAAAGTVILALLALAWVRVARAHDEGHAFPAEATTLDKLQWLIEDLTQHRTIDARDLALLAERTVNHGVESLARGQAIPEGAVRDALRAVDFGEKINPRQTDWTTLRSALRHLLARPGDDTAARPPEQKKEGRDEEDRPSQTNGQGSQQTTAESMGQGGVAKTDAALGELQKAATRRLAGPKPAAGTVRAGAGAGDPMMETTTRDPLRALTLKRYREAVKGDTPGVLFQALAGDARSEPAGGRDW